MTTMTLSQWPYGSMICGPTAVWWNSAWWELATEQIQSFLWMDSKPVPTEHWAVYMLPPLLSAFQFLELLDSHSFSVFHYRWFNINQCCFRFSFRCLLLAHRCPGVIFHVAPIHSRSCSNALWCFSIMNENKWLQEKKSVTLYISDFLKAIADLVSELLTLIPE